MIKLVNLKNGNLDCYGKSIKDFINFLRDDILEQIRKCKNDNNYEKYKLFFNNLEEKIKKDDFIKNYFNHNRNENILKGRERKMEDMVELNSFSGYFVDKIFRNKFINFHLKDLLNKEDFESIREKNISDYRGMFDEILIEKDGNNKIYFEYKSRKDFVYICFYISNKNEDMDKIKILNDLQKYTEFIIKNISDNNLLEINKLNYYYIKLERNIFDKNSNLESKGSFSKDLNAYAIENEISEDIIKYLNDKLIKEIVSNDMFINFLESFIPRD